ncbi:MAG: TIGR04255 family protein [Kofleriaceae bacterium]
MPPYPTLTNPPISEAILDIQVQLSEGTQAEHLDVFANHVGPGFAAGKQVGNAEVTIDDGEIVARSRVTLGKIYWSHDGSRAVQARTNGFTYNVVKGYRSWALHRSQAEPLWLHYLETAHPSRVKRCALRYINKIEIPVGVDVNQVLRTRPQMPESLSKSFLEMFMRVVVPIDEDRRAIITQNLPSTASENAGFLLVDVDVFSTRSLEPRSTAVWDEFEVLHEHANRCFFESIQPQALERYK